MLNLLHFFFSAYLYTIGKNRAQTISSILQIPQTSVFDFALNPLWKPACRLFGYKGEFRMKGLEKHRKARREYKKSVHEYHANRLNACKILLRRYYGMMQPDFARAERMWTKMFSQGVQND